eukprot:5286512-Prymnesium_polylepis.1
MRRQWWTAGACGAGHRWLRSEEAKACGGGALGVALKAGAAEVAEALDGGARHVLRDGRVGANEAAE